MNASPAPAQFLILIFFAVPFVVFLYLFWLYWTRGRDPRRDAISTQYEPPDELSPGECGALVDNVVGMRNITATIVDLSVKGFLSIEQPGIEDGSSEQPSDAAGLEEQNAAARAPGKNLPGNYVFHLRRPPEEWGILRPHQQKVLHAIFFPTNPLRMLTDAMSRVQNVSRSQALSAAVSRVKEMATGTPAMRALNEAQEPARSSVTLLDLQNHFYLHMTEIRQATFDALVAGGYYLRRPDQTRLVYAAGGVVTGLLMVMAGIFLAQATGTNPLPWIFTALLTGAILLGFGRLLTPRTTEGARTFAKILGFRDFIGRVEKDRIERLEKTPELFEQYLPYAMVLGVESNWTRAFAGVTVPPPHWYQREYGSNFLPIHLVDDINGMSSRAAALADKPDISPGVSSDAG